jgi:hypothetical protein
MTKLRELFKSEEESAAAVPLMSGKPYTLND